MGAAQGILGYKGQQETNMMNQNMMQQQMNFQEQERSTAHQVEVHDLKAAGLNPILSAGGTGAAVGMPGLPQMSSPMSSLSGAISKGMDTAIALRGQNKDIEGKDAVIQNTKQDTANKIAQQSLIENQQQQTAKDVEAKGYANKVMRETLDAQIKKAKAEGDFARVNQIMGIIHSGASSAGQLLKPMQFLNDIGVTTQPNH